MNRLINLVFGLLLAVFLIVPAIFHGKAENNRRQFLSFEDRVSAQRAIESVYWKHRIWPKENTSRKPAFDEEMSQALLQNKVIEYLRQSSALEIYWQSPITAKQLQAELVRMAAHSQKPDLLRELWAALGNDPVLIAECLARPLLAERELRERSKEKGLKQAEIQALLETSPINSPTLSHLDDNSPAWHLPEISLAVAPCGSEGWSSISTTGAPTARAYHLAIWTGVEMIVWGGQGPDGYDAVGGRYNPATDTWAAMTDIDAPSPRLTQDIQPIWTGSEMIIWGGMDNSRNFLNSGGRYNPITNQWRPTSLVNAPSARVLHKTIWTGNEVIIWGGSSIDTLLNTGSRYNPQTNTWTTISNLSSPVARIYFTATWIGTDLMIWGGVDSLNNKILASGGRYNPALDKWKEVETNIIARRDHIAVWTGNEVIVWGGYINQTGGTDQNLWLYDPTNNLWQVKSTNYYLPPQNYAAFWTGTEMIVWGSQLNAGGKYNPAKNEWNTITKTPVTKFADSVIWTGSELISWGGFASGRTRTGVRYGKIPQASISPFAQSFFAAGGSGNINVKAQGDCTWLAQSNDTWLNITSTSNGVGDGIINFNVSPNNSQSDRTGTFTIANTSFTVIQSAANPIATISELNPNAVLAGSQSFTLTINGIGFVPGSTIRWNGSNRTTTLISNTRVIAQVSLTDVLRPETVDVTVFNPPPIGGISNSLSLTINPSLVTVSAASFITGSLAPESVAAAFGTSITSQIQSATTLPLPTTLAGTNLRIKDSAGVERFSPLFFVAPTQINYLVPAGTASGIATVTVTNSDGKQSIGTAQIQSVAPSLFTANANGQGVPAAVLLRARGNTQTFESIARLDSATNRYLAVPIDLGLIDDQVVLLLFGTGIRGRSSLASVTCQIGGVNVPVSFAGAQGNLAGLDQLNIGVLPRILAGRGEVDLILTVDNKPANKVNLVIK